jgi:hypothetical protein
MQTDLFILLQEPVHKMNTVFWRFYASECKHMGYIPLEKQILWNWKYMHIFQLILFWRSST